PSHSPPQLYTLSLHDALPIFRHYADCGGNGGAESLHRTRIGSPYAADGFAAATQWLVATSRGVVVWHCTGGCRRCGPLAGGRLEDRKSTRLNSSHVSISYAVF